jgi:hypothetical protein
MYKIGLFEWGIEKNQGILAGKGNMSYKKISQKSL